MPDREAFIAAIAAAPDDDLPRLVFADWLDEHGEPERAEFIRAQVEAEREPSYEQRKAFERRAADLFADHWVDWFTPVWWELHTAPGVWTWPSEWGWAGEAGWIKLSSSEARRVSTHPWPYQFVVERGFLHAVAMNAGSEPKPLGFADAFRREPINSLAVTLPNDSRHWAALTDPALRRLTRLRVHGHPFGVTPLWTDPHLAGVRRLTLRVAESGEWVREFAASPLAYRLDVLNVQLGDGGMRPLARSSRLRPRELRISHAGDQREWRHLATAEWVNGVERLRIGDIRDDGLAALAAGSWHKLVELELNSSGLTDAGLRHLAAASFTPHLEVLDLSSNPLFDGENLEGLRELAAALNPASLRLLNLQHTGLDAMPDFLANLFGDRVVV